MMIMVVILFGYFLRRAVVSDYFFFQLDSKIAHYVMLCKKRVPFTEKYRN
jgi:hypothetical protein